jgi:Tol biopolymer transport system component
VRIVLALSAALLLLSVGPGATAGTSTPPRNGLIAIYGGDGFYLVDPAVGSAVRVPNAEGVADAAWSPDGTRLAVTLWQDDGETGVYTLRPDGTDRVLVTREASSPTWSPDGRWLAVVREDLDGGSWLVLVSVDGGKERVLVPAGAVADFVTTPAWSPDGKFIAFADGYSRIELVTPDGERHAGFDVDATGGSLSWSPDSSRLAFDSVRDSKDETRNVLGVLDLATGKETVLLGEQEGAMAPAWSPEGDQIAFLSMRLKETQRTTTSHSCGGEPYAMHLWSMRPDGTKAHRLVEVELYGPPSWGRAAETVFSDAR